MRSAGLLCCFALLFVCAELNAEPTQAINHFSREHYHQHMTVLQAAYPQAELRYQHSSLKPHGFEQELEWHQVYSFWQAYQPGPQLPDLANFGPVNATALTSALLRHPQLEGTVERLQQLRLLQRYPWQPVKLARWFIAGHNHQQIQTFKQRLILLGDLEADANPDELFDLQLLDAVERFQQRHGLTVDGVIGPKTAQWLNFSPAQRAHRLASDLISDAYLQAHLPSHYVLINLAGYQLNLVLDGQPRFQSRVVVGMPSRPTPVMQSSVRSLVLKPSWNVPGKLVWRDVMPRARRQPNYLSSYGFEVRDRNGQKLSLIDNDWNDFSHIDLPIRVKQNAGPKNALGQVKFYLNNERAIYLHDTPQQSLFDKPERAFSSGCVRVENAMQLAQTLADFQPISRRYWPRKQATPAPDQWLKLDQPIPVFMVYRRSWQETQGLTQFRRDVYALEQNSQQNWVSSSQND